MQLEDSDVAGLLTFIVGASHSKVKLTGLVGIVRSLSLLTELRPLISTYQAIRVSETYGW